MALVPRNSRLIPSYARNLLAGLALTNNGGDPNNDLDIAVGTAIDSTNTVVMSLTTGLTKRLDANWVAGNNQGGLDTGSKAASTTYHVHLISNGINVDVLYSTSATAPVLPLGYSYFRRIASIITDGSANFRQFQQTGNVFMYNQVIDSSFFNTGNLSNSAVGLGAIPTGVRFRVIGHFACFGINNQSTGFGFLTSRNQGAPGADSVTVGGVSQRTDIMSSSAHTGGEASANWHQNHTQFQLMTDTNAQLLITVATSIGGNINVRIRVFGYIDTRGQD